MASNKSICNYFYTKLDPSTYKCRYVAFENAIITALNQLPLTAEQEDLLHVFNPSMEVETPGKHNGKFCGSSFGKKKRKAGFSVSNLPWIPCTSNVAERLFSSVSYVLTDFRAKISPVNLESQIFLMCSTVAFGVSALLMK